MNRQHVQLLGLAGGALATLGLIACGSSNNNSSSKATNSAQPSAAAPAITTSPAATNAAVSTAAGTGAAGTSAATKPAGTPTAAAAKVRRGGTLTVSAQLNPKQFDPMVTNDVYSGYLNNQVFENLTSLDENLKPVPWLADSWDISADGKEYTFHLHKGVKFHDGTDFNAAAEKFSLDRIRNNKASVGQSDCGPNLVSDVQVVDDSTLKVVLVNAYAPFLVKLSGTRCGAAVSPTAVQKQGDDDFAQHPVGTGPFKFLEFKQDDHYSVTKFDGYWKMGTDGKALPYLDKVTWKVINDGNEQLQALINGDVDIVASLDDKLVGQAKQAPNVVIDQQPGLGWRGFMLNVSKPPFNNKALAQAVNFAIDRAEVIRVIYDNVPLPQENGVIPAPLSYAVDASYKPYTYDPAKAKAKLAEGGQPNGFSFTFLTDESNPVTQQHDALIQSQLKKVGIDMQIDNGDFNTVVVKRGLAGDYQAAGVTISGGADPDSWVYSTFHSDPANPITGFNLPHLNDPAIDKLAEQGRQESDINKRADIYKQATKLIMDYSPWVIEANRPARFSGNKKVQNYVVLQKATTGYAEYWKTSD